MAPMAWPECAVGTCKYRRTARLRERPGPRCLPLSLLDALGLAGDRELGCKVAARERVDGDG